MIDELKELEINKLSDTPNKLAEIERINACRNIIELGYSVESAIKTLEANGIPVVLREADKVIIPHEDVKFNSMDDFIAVHKDKYIPVNSTIQTPTEAKAKLRTSYFLGGRYFEVESMFYRDSVHFALNGEVEEIGIKGPKWDKFPIAILIKLSSISIGERGQYSLGDLFTDGHVKLDSNVWILCPLGYKDKILEKNPRFRG